MLVTAVETTSVTLLVAVANFAYEEDPRALDMCCLVFVAATEDGVEDGGLPETKTYVVLMEPEIEMEVVEVAVLEKVMLDTLFDVDNTVARIPLHILMVCGLILMPVDVEQRPRISEALAIVYYLDAIQAAERLMNE